MAVAESKNTRGRSKRRTRLVPPPQGQHGPPSIDQDVSVEQSMLVPRRPEMPCDDPHGCKKSGEQEATSALGRLRKAAKRGEGSRGGKVIGHTSSGNPVYSSHDAPHSSYSAHFSPKEHAEAHLMHITAAGMHAKAGNAVEASVHRLSAGFHSNRMAKSRSSRAMSPAYPSVDGLLKSAADLLEKMGGEGSRGGKIIGHTRSGKPVYAADGVKYRRIGEGSPERYRRHVNAMKQGYRSFTPEDHEDAIHLHQNIADSHYQKLHDLRIAARKDPRIDFHWQSMPLYESERQSGAAVTGHQAALEDARGSFIYKSKGEGSRGGKIIGHTKGGKPVYQARDGFHDSYKDFSDDDHEDAIEFHAHLMGRHQLKAKNSQGAARVTHARRAENHKLIMGSHHDAALPDFDEDWGRN